MRLRLVGDGTAMGTRIETEDGQLIEGVISAGLYIDVGQEAEVKFTVLGTAFDIAGEFDLLSPSESAQLIADARKALDEVKMLRKRLAEEVPAAEARSAARIQKHVEILGAEVHRLCEELRIANHETVAEEAVPE